MLTLYRCRATGRGARGLFPEPRGHRLADELGLEPGTHLRQLERQILSHDSALGALHPSAAQPPSADMITAGGDRDGNRRDRRDGRRRSQTRPDRRLPGTGGDPGDALAMVDPSSGRTEQGVEFAGSPAAIATDRQSLWVADRAEGVVSRISLASGAVEDRIPVSGQPGDVAVGDGSVWVATTVGGTVRRIDPVAGTITQTIALGGTPAAIASGGTFGVGRRRYGKRTPADRSSWTGKVATRLELRCSAVRPRRGARRRLGRESRRRHHGAGGSGLEQGLGQRQRRAGTGGGRDGRRFSQGSERVGRQCPG